MNKSLHNNMDNDMNKEDMDKKTIKHSAILAAVVLAAALTLTGCGQYASQFTALLTSQPADSTAEQAEAETAADEMSRSGIYDSEDAAVVVKKDLEAKTVQFQNIASSRRYTLTYDGTTTV